MKLFLIFGFIFILSIHAEEYKEEAEFEEAHEQLEEEPIEQKIIRPRKPQPVKERIKSESKDYTLEKIVGAGLVAYFVYFFVGKTMNSNKATKFAEFCYEAIVKHFKKSNTTDSSAVGIMSVTNNNFVIELYDNPVVKGACLGFNMVKRQELFSHLFSFVNGEQDEIVVDVCLDPKIAPPCVFSILKQRQMKKFKKQYVDIEKFTKAYAGSTMKLSDKFAILTDAQPISGIINAEFLEFMERYEDSFNYLILSDQSTLVENEKCLLRCCVKCGDITIIPKVTEMIFKMAENIKNVKIEGKALEKCRKVRAEIAEKEEKEKMKKIREEINAKREEEKQKEYDMMTAEERRKYDERMRNKQIKRKVKVQKVA